MPARSLFPRFRPGLLGPWGPPATCVQVAAILEGQQAGFDPLVHLDQLLLVESVRIQGLPQREEVLVSPRPLQRQSNRLHIVLAVPVA